MKKQQFDYIICGGGASGLLLLKALSEDSFFDSSQILLIEKENKNSNDRTWCFWEEKESDFEKLLFKKWKTAQFVSENLHLEMDLYPYQYKMLRSQSFYETLNKVSQKHKNITRVKAFIKDFQSAGQNTTVFTNQGIFESQKVLNSLFDPKPLFTQKKYPVLQQHFLGWFIQTDHDCFDPKKILFMDFNIQQKNETRFLYVLPTDKRNALFEYTLFSKDVLEKQEYEQGIKNYLEAKEIDNYRITEKEQGNIPMSCFPFEQLNTSSLLHIGTAGGWTKASTGFTFQNTQRQILRLVPYLKQDKPLDGFTTKNRFRFYDLLFLEVLTQHNAKGSELFERMFAKNPSLRVFRFLDEQTSLWEELKIMSSFSLKQIGWFLGALKKQLF
jgi:lycopene beta-cyclase